MMYEMANMHQCKQIKGFSLSKNSNKKTSHLFKMDTDIIYLIQQYKYLGILLDEHLKFDLCDDLFAKSGESFIISYIKV